ncbi:MAG: hypothetical protein KKA67_06640 [Spirochaetes bacterium]|nr:hypothetical protein [Spirochaetota bacterium]MBU1080186.1 hypothetical protein [Spirochaetota bacterium]
MTERTGKRVVYLASAILAPIAVLCIAAAPLLFEKRAGVPVLVVGPALDAIAGWLRGLGDGSAFEYRFGATAWSFFDIAPHFFAVSFLYVASAGSVGLAGGMALGLSLRGRAAAAVSSFLGSLYAIPDFISAILLQLATIAILDATGFKIGRISHDAASEAFLLLPFLLLTVYPLAFAFKTTLRKSMDAEREPYAVFALSKGLSKRTVRLRHIGAAVVPALSAELPTLLGIMQANLFMAEYIFALPGITRFLFQVAFSGRRPGWIEEYQYSLAVSVLLGVMLLYLAAWGFFRLALYAVRRALTGER